ncbi:hypothetical protein CROQUDRAFT_137195 [Cronartium quercuum f. sp. fusiforme G11]|uniref:Uncharacterized protein n=1 Tax=Cronartium quercuum f. sp. fusiforme G11 TaxID=708437 RepID=A0A9P6N555_9BASI|nr:hypothetical protein CROQUDRAFT_137195 [Cronartium quercuum f. sp. fusiforme G11]
MLCLFYIYLVINIGLHVNCGLDVVQMQDIIRISQRYPVEKPGIQDILSSVNSATTWRMDHGKTSAMFPFATYKGGLERPSHELRLRTPIDDSESFKNQFPVDGEGRPIGRKRKALSALTENDNQANAKGMRPLRGKSSHKPTQKLKLSR